ncbi:MarR family transcriptional regulator [Glaciihabitans sp. UYNi722]|uniref:MarR family winged helix-turn-helix transcriptional regulator n=1 Tax=Glaciihabitans sp. UYNi722 TaxID=3156344 RepID=UPI00339B2557
MTRLASGFDQAAESTGLLLWQVTNRWQAAQRAVLKPFELTHVQFVLLASLTWYAEEGAVTQRALADRVATDPMMTSQVLRALEAGGLVTRLPHPDDGRAITVTVTDAGIALVNRAIGAVERCDAEFFGALGSLRGSFQAGLETLVSSPGPS